MNTKVIQSFQELSKLYPDKTMSELYLRITDRIIEELPTRHISNEEFIKAIDFCIKIPEFLYAECMYGTDGYYFEFNYNNKKYKINNKQLYGFRIIGNKRKRYKHIPIWEEYNSLEDIINKCYYKY